MYLVNFNRPFDKGCGLIPPRPKSCYHPQGRIWAVNLDFISEINIYLITSISPIHTEHSQNETLQVKELVEILTTDGRL